jgi:hypothetical protein
MTTDDRDDDDGDDGLDDDDGDDDDEGLGLDEDEDGGDGDECSALENDDEPDESAAEQAEEPRRSARTAGKGLRELANVSSKQATAPLVDEMDTLSSDSSSTPPIPIRKREGYISDLYIAMSAAADTVGDTDTMAVAVAFEANVAHSAKDTRSYSLAVCEKLYELKKICEGRCLAEAEDELVMADEEEAFGSLQEVMEELDRVLDYDRTLEQGVADFEMWGKPAHGRGTFLALPKGELAYLV